MSDFNKTYKINPRIREIIEKQRGKKYDLSYSNVELLLSNVFDGKYKPNIEFTDADKSKIKFYLNDFSPDSYSSNELEYFSNFLKLSFTESELLDLIEDMVKKHYKPGMVYANYRVSNKKILKLISFFNNYFDLEKGIIINIDFIGDVKKVYPDVIHDEKTGEITDSDVKDKVSEFIFTLKSKYKDDLNIIIKDNIYILSSKSEDVLKELEKINLEIQYIPLFYFNY